MTTPARIAAFLSTSALCLGLGASAANAAALSRNPTQAPQASASAEGPQGERRVQSVAPTGKDDAPAR